MVFVGAFHVDLSSPSEVVVAKTGASGAEGTSLSVYLSDFTDVEPDAPAAVIAATVNSTVEPFESPVTSASVEEPETEDVLDELISVTR